MRRILLLAALSLAACRSTEEAAPADAAPIARDVTDAAADTAPADVTDASPADVTDVPPADVTDVPPADVTDAAPTDVTDASADAADASADVTDASCVGDGGCFACPTTSDQIINRCTGSTCARFDNRARLPRLLSDGGLPPLP